MSRPTLVVLAVTVMAAAAIIGCRPRPGALGGPRGPVPSVAPAGATMAVEQSDEDPRLLTVTCPWSEHPGSTLQTVFALQEANLPADSLDFTVTGGDLDEVLALTRMMADQTGVETRTELGDLGVIALKNHLGNVAAYVTTGLERGEPPIAVGAAARYFDLRDWANEETDALEVQLDAECFDGAGELCVALMSAEGDEVASATTQITFEHPTQGSDNDE